MANNRDQPIEWELEVTHLPTGRIYRTYPETERSVLEEKLIQIIEALADTSGRPSISFRVRWCADDGQEDALSKIQAVIPYGIAVDCMYNLNQVPPGGVLHKGEFVKRKV